MMRQPSVRSIVRSAPLFIAVAAGLLTGSDFAVKAHAGDDWPQWRGPARNGLSSSKTALIESLPESGLQPLWVSQDRIEGGGNGGWSSPLVSGERVYCFSHRHAARPDVTLPAETYPPLDEKTRGDLSKEEAAEYDEKRNVEQKARRKLQYKYEDVVLCLDLKTGKRLWKHERESVPTGFGQSGTPAIAHGRLYYISADRTAVCLDAESGEVIFKTPLPVDASDEQISSSVVIVDGAVVVLAGDLVAFDATSGELLWKAEKSRMTGMDSSPSVWMHQGRTYVLAHVNGGETVCVEPRTGKERWRVKSQANRSTPVVVGDRMLTLGDNRKNGLRCFQLSEDRAELLWNYQRLSDPGSSPVVVDDHVYVQGENRLACVHLGSGQETWQTTLDLSQPRYTSLVAADGKVFYAFDGVLAFAADPNEFRPLMEARLNKAGRLAPIETYRKELGLAKLESGEKGQEEAQKVWQREVTAHNPLGCSSPALANGRLILRRNDDLVCYDLARRRSAESVTKVVP